MSNEVSIDMTNDARTAGSRYGSKDGVMVPEFPVEGYGWPLAPAGGSIRPAPRAAARGLSAGSDGCNVTKR
jgi:hypothetical protein